MIDILLAAAHLTGQNPTPGQAIDAAFADLDRRYFAMLISESEAGWAVIAEGPREATSNASRCLGLLGPLHRELDTKPLRREMQLFAAVTPEHRLAVLEVARATARDQALRIRLSVQVLEALERDCLAIPIYSAQRLDTMELREDVVDVLTLLIDQPPTGAPPTE